MCLKCLDVSGVSRGNVVKVEDLVTLEVNPVDGDHILTVVDKLDVCFLD